MRWQFIDPNDLDEAKQRRPITEAMDRWWVAFERHAGDLAHAFSPAGRESGFDVAEFTNGNLKAVDPELCWEYGPAVRSNGHRLVITPEGKRRARPMVSELLRRAPKLAGWEFYPGRLPEPPETAFAVAEQIAGVKPPGGVHVKVALGRHRRVDLTYHIPGVGPGDRDMTHFVFRATEQMLGEEVLDRWLGGIEIAPSRSLKDKLLGRRVPGLVEPERLRPTVDALIAASREQLPEVTARQRAQQDPDADGVTWSGLELKPPEQEDYAARDDLFILVTPEVELTQAAVSDPLFHSARFSRTGETFCYLKVERIGGENAEGGGVFRDIDSADARGRLEEMTNATLAEHALGCTFGGGTGRRYAYIDLALTDVPRAIPVLRDFVRRAALSLRSWLLFFDAEYADEWVGLHERSPKPMLPS